ncbi:MAG: hypothetical protein GPJ54_11670 [Candidatus Heimdallarchaeota archaeon]|nr:hypothetical protein [Candidatus Heimdallarchaeota archaeon]
MIPLTFDDPIKGKISEATYILIDNTFYAIMLETIRYYNYTTSSTEENNTRYKLIEVKLDEAFQEVAEINEYSLPFNLEKDYFGLTKHEDKFYTVESLYNQASLISFSLDDQYSGVVERNESLSIASVHIDSDVVVNWKIDSYEGYLYTYEIGEKDLVQDKKIVKRNIDTLEIVEVIDPRDGLSYYASIDSNGIFWSARSSQTVSNVYYGYSLDDFSTLVSSIVLEYSLKRDYDRYTPTDPFVNYIHQHTLDQFVYGSKIIHPYSYEETRSSGRTWLLVGFNVFNIRPEYPNGQIFNIVFASLLDLLVIIALLKLIKRRKEKMQKI